VAQHWRGQPTSIEVPRGVSYSVNSSKRPSDSRMIANGMVEKEFTPSHSTAYLYEGSFVLYFCPRIWKLTEWPLPFRCNGLPNNWYRNRSKRRKMMGSCKLLMTFHSRAYSFFNLEHASVSRKTSKSVVSRIKFCFVVLYCFC
jgi:hypothetical protein